MNYNNMKNIETRKIQKKKGERRWEVAKSRKLPLRANEPTNRNICRLKIMKLRLAELLSSYHYHHHYHHC